MSTNYERVQRRRWAAPGGGGQRTPNGSDIEADFTEFHYRLSQLRNASVQRPGIVSGLEVTGILGDDKVIIEGGVAIDHAGHLVVLADNGFAGIGDGPDGTRPAQTVVVPVSLPLTGVSNGSFFLTIKFREEDYRDPSNTNHNLLEQRPWIRLLSDDLVDQQTIILGLVNVNAGRLAAIAIGSADYRRRMWGGIFSELTFARSDESDTGGAITIAESLAASISATAIGIAVSGAVSVQGDLEAQANARVGGKLNVEGERIVAKAATIDGDVEIGGNTRVRGELTVEGPKVTARRLMLPYHFDSEEYLEVISGGIRIVSKFRGGREANYGSNSISLEGVGGRGGVEIDCTRGRGELRLVKSNGEVAYHWDADHGLEHVVGTDSLDSAKRIVYTCLEGAEAAVYCRGRSRLNEGRDRVLYSDHFAGIVNVETTTIQLTPRSASSKGLAVVSQSADGFSVCELGEGTGNYEFDYFVTGVRRGHEAFEAVVDAERFNSAEVKQLEDGKARSAPEATC